jgi:hypothetical protein
MAKGGDFFRGDRRVIFRHRPKVWGI